MSVSRFVSPTKDVVLLSVPLYLFWKLMVHHTNHNTSSTFPGSSSIRNPQSSRVLCVVHHQLLIESIMFFSDLPSLHLLPLDSLIVHDFGLCSPPISLRFVVVQYTFPVSENLICLGSSLRLRRGMMDS